MFFLFGRDLAVSTRPGFLGRHREKREDTQSYRRDDIREEGSKK